MKNRWIRSLQVSVLGAMLLVSHGALLAKPGKGNKQGKASEKQEAKQQRKAAFYVYDQYPNLGVYYNRTTDTYYWIDSGKWCHGRSLPGNIALGGQRDKIRIGDETPYAYHQVNHERLPYEYSKKNFGKRRGPPDQAPAWGYRRKFGYIYYPRHDVYYDPNARNYAWVESGKMKIGYELPDWIKVDPYGGVTIELERAVDIDNFKNILH